MAMDLHYDSLLGISQRIRAGETTSVQVTQALLDRIGRYDGRLHSTLLVMAGTALAQAQAADAASAANNLTGIKPTWGRVSRHGLIHLAESLDHLGPMARSARDAAAILQAIAGLDPKDPTMLRDPVPDYLGQADSGVAGLRLGID